jgi:hypothetical protein
VKALRDSLNAPGLTDAARTQIQDMITKLEDAQKAGDVTAILTLTGVDTTKGELDDATADRDTKINVETRGGPAVKTYLGELTADRLTLIRVETRNGPAVREYLESLTAERLAIIRVETRGGPDVDAYLDRLATQARTAYIDVRHRAGDPIGQPFGAPTMRGAPLAAAGSSPAGSIVIQSLTIQPQVDSGGRLTTAGAQVTGRAVVGAIREYTRQNGTGWSQGLLR